MKMTSSQRWLLGAWLAGTAKLIEENQKPVSRAPLLHGEGCDLGIPHWLPLNLKIVVDLEGKLLYNIYIELEKELIDEVY